jgi:uncharacterized peroxidase-related enzyme
MRNIMPKFTMHTIDSAPEESKNILMQSEKSVGFIPNIYAILAESPLLLKTYKELGNLFNKTSFTEIEKEVIEMTINQVNGCTYCIAAHNYFATLSNFPEKIIISLLEDKPFEDSKLQILRLFTKTVIEKKGSLTNNEIDVFLSAGYTNKHILELIIGVSHKIISNYVNHIAKTPIDEQFSSK